MTDSASLSYDEWVRWTFDHPLPQKEDDCWYVLSEEICFISPLKMIEYSTLLFRNFKKVTETYSLPQVDQGVWLLIGGRDRIFEQDFFDCLFPPWGIDSPVLLEPRVECINAMYSVFSDFVSTCRVETLENCFDMWWDFVCESFWSHASSRRRAWGKEISYEDLEPDEKILLDTVFSVLSQILLLEDLRTQGHALHGLGHSKHPDAKSLVDRYIINHGPEWTESGQEWLRQCRDGTVM